MNRIAFDLGPLSIHWYGVLVACGFLAGLWTASRRAMKAGISPDIIMDMGPWLILGGIIGARILYVITEWNAQFAQEPWYEMFMVQRGGMVYYGGFVGATITGVFFVHRRDLSLWKLADVLVPSLSLGQAFGRIGCLLNGCCYGMPTKLPWAIHYPIEHETHAAGVHPTQLYEAGVDLALWGVLAWVFKWKQFNGQVFAIYLIAYSCLRSTIEIFRGDYPPEQMFGPFTPAQVVSLILVVIGVVLYMKLPRPQPTTIAENPSPKTGE